MKASSLASYARMESGSVASIDLSLARARAARRPPPAATPRSGGRRLKSPAPGLGATRGRAPDPLYFSATEGVTLGDDHHDADRTHDVDRRRTAAGKLGAGFCAR